MTTPRPRDPRNIGRFASIKDLRQVEATPDSAESLRGKRRRGQITALVLFVVGLPMVVVAHIAGLLALGALGYLVLLAGVVELVDARRFGD